MKVVVLGPGPVSIVQSECEGGGRLTEVEEELGEDVNSKETVGGKVLVRETHDDEENGQDAETTKLDSLATDGIDGSDGNPVSGNGTSKDNNDVTDGSVVEVLVDVGGILGRVANDLENGTVVQGETVKGHIEAEP